tara:strand:+ start:726 stop:1052 length:327 start_codon:yes stop_codon:yes gene_type:complete
MPYPVLEMISFAIKGIPDMWRPEPVADFAKPVGIYPEVVVELLLMSFRKLAIIFLNKSNSLFSRDLAVSYFMSCIRSATADAVFDVGEIIVGIIEAIIKARILAIRSS